jgi:hypothetical protein
MIEKANDGGDRSVTLAVTVHQPDERLAELAEAQLPVLVERYAAIAAYCSGETHGTIVEILRRHGALVTVDTGKSAGIYRTGVVRRATVRAGLRPGTEHLQLCDFDRAIHWAARHLQELEDLIDALPHYDLLVLGRTPRAWSTHPPYQSETEPLFNRVFALATGLAWDIGAGSRGLSRRAAEALLRLSRERTVGVDAEWPLLLLRWAERPAEAAHDGFRVGYRACEGLEFETADRFGPEIEAAGGYGPWEAQMSAEPQHWAYRLKVAQLIAEAVIRYGGCDR